MDGASPQYEVDPSSPAIFQPILDSDVCGRKRRREEEGKKGN